MAMLTLQDVEGLSYRELQAQCKERNLKATGKASELIERLKESIAATAPPKAAPSKPQAAASKGAPSKTTKAKAPASPKAAAFAHAVQSLLPRKADAPAAKPTRVRAAARPPATRTPTPPRQQSPRLFLATLLLALLGAMLGAYVFLQQPQHAQLRADVMAHVAHYHAIVSDRVAPLVHTVGDVVGPHIQAAHEHLSPYIDAVAATVAKGLHRADQVLAPLVHQVDRVLLEAVTTLQQWWQPLGAELSYRLAQWTQWGSLQWQHVVQFFTTQLGAHTLKGLVREEPHWQSVMQAVQPGAAADDQPSKATAVLLAAAPASVAAVSQQLAARVLGRCGGDCTQQLHGRDWSGKAGRTRGELQAALGSFFKGCPAGAVVVSEVEKMHPALLPVLNNVLSEQGNLQVDGVPVPTDKGSFWFVATVPDAMYSKSSSPDFAGLVKTRLARQWSKYDDEQQVDKEHPQTLTALALRRRFDHVLPAHAA